MFLHHSDIVEDKRPKLIKERRPIADLLGGRRMKLKWHLCCKRCTSRTRGEMWFKARFQWQGGQEEVEVKGEEM